MKLLINTWFSQFARKQRLPDAALIDAVDRANRGLIDADLGGGVIKQRIARAGQGRSGGYRAIILFRKADRAFLVYGFPKNARDNVSPEELRAFRSTATILLSLSDDMVTTLVQDGAFREIDNHDQKLQE